MLARADAASALAVRLTGGRFPTAQARLGAREAQRLLKTSWKPIYKAPFAPVGEETLAGGLSNTIAGRICNYFHLNGGGYTLDGACGSSLLAVANACSALESGDLDAALAGGVDLSLDPFELVGFCRLGALARGEMRVYDEEPTGFLPGEGCGFVLLMRHDDAISLGLRCYAVIRGWGISSDGGGGITRPEANGQRLALQRAYRRAGYPISSVDYFEGHGTGTPVGDEVELRTVSAERSADPQNSHPAVIGSVKANIGHTKAAAGIAGCIKATMALSAQILPPNTGVRKPHPELVQFSTRRQGHGERTAEGSQREAPPALRVLQVANAGRRTGRSARESVPSDLAESMFT